METRLRKKILYIVESLPRGGGAERAVADQINNLDQSLFDVHLCLLKEDGLPSLVGDLNLPDSHKKIVIFNSKFDFKAWVHLIVWLKREEFEAVCSHLYFANQVARIAGRLAGIKRIISFEQNVYLDRPLRQRIFNGLFSRLSSKIIAVSFAVKKYLIDFEYVSAAKISVLYNSVILDNYRFDPLARENMRKKFGLSQESFVVLSVGEISRQKEYGILIETANEVVNNRGKQIFFFIAGNDRSHLAETLRNRCEKLGISSQVNFLGLRDDVPQLLSMADVFFMPSRFEGLSLALIEALACGRPVVVSAIDSLKEAVKDGEYGIIGEDSKSFANWIIKLSEDRNLYLKYHQSALCRAEDFNLKKNILKINELF